MRVLLDTHVLMGALADSTQLSARARAVLADSDNECWVSSASVWEIAITLRLLTADQVLVKLPVAIAA